MEFIPHLLIEGMITSSFALGANLSYIYIRGEYMWVYKILETIAEAKAAGWLGKKYIRDGYDLELYVHIGAVPIFVKKQHL
jgi:NADH-quinone oxidoreductase subunit F